MAMGAAKDRSQTFQVEMVCLDELVEADDRYRRLDELVDWSFVRTAAAPYYAEGGRPSVDPVVLVKLMLVGALEGTRSMREVLRQAKVRLDVRRVLGDGLAERLPVHQTLSMALTRRFLDGRLFARLFARSVALCAAHGLLEGTHISVDGFHVEADAALSSLRASLGPVEPDPEAPAAERPQPAPSPHPAQLALAPPPARGASAPPRRSSNQTARARSDPDAALRHKPGQRPHLVLRGQVGVDPKVRCVVGCLAERATGFEGDGLGALLDRARFVVPGLRSVAADQGYAAERVWRDLDRRRLRAYIPPPAYMLTAPAPAGWRCSTSSCWSSSPPSTASGWRATPRPRTGRPPGPARHPRRGRRAAPHRLAPPPERRPRGRSASRSTERRPPQQAAFLDGPLGPGSGRTGPAGDRASDAG